MGMTKEERLYKSTIKHQLMRQEGYVTMANYIEPFDFHITEDPNCIACIIPSKKEIRMNRQYIDDAYIRSMLIRHEAMHQILAHIPREIELLEKKYKGRNINKELGAYLGNIAGDLDLSRYYNLHDIAATKQLKGLLISNYNNKDYSNMDFEEIFNDLLSQHEKEQDDLDQQCGDTSGSDGDDSQESSPDNNSSQQNTDSEESSANNSSSNQSSKNAAEELLDNIASGKVQIGDRGSEEIARKEEQQRAEKIKGESPENVQDTHNTVDKVDDINNAAEIEKILNDPTFKDKMKQEAERVKRIQELKLKKSGKLIQTDNDVYKIHNSGAIYRFKSDFNDFLKSLENEDEDPDEIETNAIPNRRHSHERDGVIRKGVKEVPPEHSKPKILVLFDASSSWADFIPQGEKAVAALNDYRRNNIIDYELVYVKNDIYKNENSSNGFFGADCPRGGSANGPAMLKYIALVKPDNIVVMTDSDADYGMDKFPYMYTLPKDGHVWIITSQGYPPFSFASALNTKNKKFYYL